MSCYSTYGNKISIRLLGVGELMSRIGKVPIALPQGVEVKIDGNKVVVKSGKGELSRIFNPAVAVLMKEKSLVVTCPQNNRKHRALWGLSRTLLANMVDGVTKGFERYLEISGVGYRAQTAGDKLILQVGYNHPVEFQPPKGVSITVEGANRIKVSGIDKELVGEVAAKVRAIRPADSYKGKGIKYVEERLRLKPGKAGRAAMKK